MNSSQRQHLADKLIDTARAFRRNRLTTLSECLPLDTPNGCELSGRGSILHSPLQVPVRRTSLAFGAASPVRSSEWLDRLPQLATHTLTPESKRSRSKLSNQPVNASCDYSPNDGVSSDAVLANWKYPKPTARSRYIATVDQPSELTTLPS